jgi:cytochrome c-type biogenesis protein CcmH
MLLWFVFASMTAAAIFAVLWPLGRAADEQAGSDLAVYRDQLDELERDRRAGLIGEAEAQAARIEVSRRLITAADAAEFANSLPVGSGNPNDARGYEVLAPVYLRFGRFADAVNARRKLLALKGENAERQSDLGEALAATANGIVTAEAKTAFDRALAIDPKELKARFFIGLAAEQDGDRTKAATIWRGMLEGAPSDAPWLPMVREALGRVTVTPHIAASPGPSAEDVAAAGSMNEKDRGEMIRGMVARLAERLKENGSDIEGWQRLLRAYMVLGERNKAQDAAGDAKKAFSNDPDKLRRIEDMIKSLGIDG